MRNAAFRWSLTILILCPAIYPADCQYHPVAHRSPAKGETAISEAGSYDRAGAVYVLTKDISCSRSTLFLGNNVTLDLNGYTVRFADANYGHVPNAGFEEGSGGWDLSGAPGAKIENTDSVHVFLGKKLLSLKAGDEIRSGYVYLPEAGRSYFAMCGITGWYYHQMKKYPDDEMKISLFVEDENGNDVKCSTMYGDGVKVSCPVLGKSPRLGGGFITAHLSGLPAGKYRIRVKAVTDCLVDQIDIRPAMDAGISIIEKTTPLASYDHLIRESYPPITPAFYDYTGDFAACSPLASIPSVSGEGTIIIRNGTIEGGSECVQAWGVQSSAKKINVILDNVRIKTSGISTGAADILRATILNCRFDTDMPFLIQRHVNLCSVLIRGFEPSEVSNSEFYGGQGCLSIRGKHSLVHDNLFVNDQWVTNHYSIMGTGDSSKIYNNRFEPRQGSGIYVSRYTEVFNNLFRISTSAPTCEYGREYYSTAAIRLGDYLAVPGSGKESVGSRIHNNRIIITAKDWPGPDEYLPMSWGIYYSARGGQNYVYDNDIIVNKTEPGSRVVAAPLYICGGPKYFGGEFYNNRITTNVPAAWIGTIYGGASNSDLHDNTIIPLNDAMFSTFRIGYDTCSDCAATGIRLRSNIVKGQPLTIAMEGNGSSYQVSWTLGLTILGSNGEPLKDTEVTIRNCRGEKVLVSRTGADGSLRTELPSYSIEGTIRTSFTPYTIIAGNIERNIELDNNKEIVLQ